MNIQLPASASMRSASLKLFAIGLGRCRIVLMMGPFPESGLDGGGPSCETVEPDARCPAVDIRSFWHAASRRGEGICEPPHSNWSTAALRAAGRGVVVFVAALESLVGPLRQLPRCSEAARSVPGAADARRRLPPYGSERVPASPGPI